MADICSLRLALSVVFRTGSLMLCGKTKGSYLKFSFPAEKFKAARSHLMLPHPKGEAASIASAFAECAFGISKVDPADLDDYARELLSKLNALIDPIGLRDPADRGMYTIKAEKLSIEQRRELSSTVDELASWFDLKSRTS